MKKIPDESAVSIARLARLKNAAVLAGLFRPASTLCKLRLLLEPGHGELAVWLLRHEADLVADLHLLQH